MIQMKKRKHSEEVRSIEDKIKSETEGNKDGGHNNTEQKFIKKEKNTKKYNLKDEDKAEEEKQDEGKRGRAYTVSIAVAASIMDIPQTLELKTCLVGQIARAAAVNNVDEIIIFDDTNTMIKREQVDGQGGKASRNCSLMLKLLEYLECPQYLRKYFFPIQPDLRFAGLLNPLDAPHQMRADDLRSVYREGVVVKKETREGDCSYANVGLYKDCLVDRCLLEGVRCTVKIDNYHIKKLKGTLVSLDEPRTREGVYWGYKTRVVVGLTEVLQGPYDCVIGTSDKGSSVDNFTMPPFKSLLIVFGGVHGLETCIESDEHCPATKPHDLFEHYINTRPNQGSATIRAEEAILITLAALRPQIELNRT